MSRLNSAILSQLATIAQPSYCRDQIKAGIVHLGIGAFHRAHQAYYTEQVLNTFGGDWGIIGCSLRSSTVRQQLEPQDGLYTLLVRGEQSTPQIIGAVKAVLVGPEDPQAVIGVIADEQTKIVSLTITEKGYCHHPATGELNFEHPDIQSDLNQLDAPTSAIGYIVAGLSQRMKKSLPGLSVMSCDNLPDNGKVTKQVVLAFAKTYDTVLFDWILANVSFPGTMIDRIVPATTQSDIAEFEANFGYSDQGMVCAEPFSQWVIEDDFCVGRPQWEGVGALIVKDVSAYEKMKLRLLNGSHSLLAYVGFLSGYDTIYQTMQDPDLVRLTRQFMIAASQTLAMPEGFSVDDYQQQLLDRFGNPGLQHRTWQIAMDGSQKIPQRWLNTLRDLIRSKQNVDVFCFALAAWMRYCMGIDENENTIELSDPLAKQLKALAEDNANQWLGYVKAFFSVEEIFEHDFIANSVVIEKTSVFLEAIYSEGMLSSFKQVSQGEGVS